MSRKENYIFSQSSKNIMNKDKWVIKWFDFNILISFF